MFIRVGSAETQNTHLVNILQISHVEECLIENEDGDEVPGCMITCIDATEIPVQLPIEALDRMLAEAQKAP